jgi:hypothetical protein
VGCSTIHPISAGLDAARDEYRPFAFGSSFNGDKELSLGGGASRAFGIERRRFGVDIGCEWGRFAAVAIGFRAAVVLDDLVSSDGCVAGPFASGSKNKVVQ